MSSFEGSPYNNFPINNFFKNHPNLPQPFGVPIKHPQFGSYDESVDGQLRAQSDVSSKSDSDSQNKSIPSSPRSEKSESSVTSSSFVANTPTTATPVGSLINYIDYTTKPYTYTPKNCCNPQYNHNYNSDEIIDDTTQNCSKNVKKATKISKDTEKKDKTTPKQIPLGLKAFQAFAKNNRAFVKQSYPDFTLGQVQSKLGEMWKQLSTEEKQQWRLKI